MIDEGRFWTMIGDARSATTSSDAEAITEEIERRLASMDPPTICEFDDRLREVVARAHTNKMSGAESIISGFESDNGFLYFVHWLVLQGRRTFERAIENPGSIAEIESPGAEHGAESLMYAAANAFEESTGDEMPVSEFSPDTSFRGDKPRGEASELYPQLWKKYRDAKGRPKSWPAER